MSFVGLAMTPKRSKDDFEGQMEAPMDAALLDVLAQFNGQSIAAGLAAAAALELPS